MSKHEWKPGDLAVVTTQSGREYRAVYTLAPGIDYFWNQIGNERLRGQLVDPDASARPLVVIDPEDREQVERLLCGYAGWRGRRDELKQYPHFVDDMQAALREFANPTPPKPNEPTGLGAVVESEDGKRWIRVEPDGGIAKWLLSRAPEHTDPRYVWSAVPAVRVLSEGVS